MLEFCCSWAANSRTFGSSSVSCPRGLCGSGAISSTGTCSIASAIGPLFVGAQAALQLSDRHARSGNHPQSGMVAQLRRVRRRPDGKTLAGPLKATLDLANSLVRVAKVVFRPGRHPPPVAQVDQLSGLELQNGPQVIELLAHPLDRSSVVGAEKELREALRADRVLFALVLLKNRVPKVPAEARPVRLVISGDVPQRQRSWEVSPVVRHKPSSSEEPIIVLKFRSHEKVWPHHLRASGLWSSSGRMRSETPSPDGSGDAIAERPRPRGRGPLLEDCLERWFVVELAALGRPLAVGPGAGGPLGLGDGPAQAGGDVVGVDFGDGALLAFAGLEGAGAEPADDDGAVALGEGCGGVLGLVAPDVDAEEAGLAVAPGAVSLADALVDRQAEVGDRGAVLGEAQFGVVGEVTDLDGEVVVGHRVPSCEAGRVPASCGDRSVAWRAVRPGAHPPVGG